MNISYWKYSYLWENPKFFVNFLKTMKSIWQYRLTLSFNPVVFQNNIGWNYYLQWEKGKRKTYPFTLFFSTQKKKKKRKNGEIFTKSLFWMEPERGVVPKALKKKTTLNLIQWSIYLFSKDINKRVTAWGNI